MTSTVLEAIDIGKFYGVGAGRFQALAAAGAFAIFCDEFDARCF